MHRLDIEPIIIIDLVMDTSAVTECIPNWSTLKEAKLAEIGMNMLICYIDFVPKQCIELC